MHAIEFEATAQNGAITIPDAFKSLFSKPVRVKVLVDDSGTETARYQQNLTEIESVLGQINCDFSDFKFDREQANAR
jgi:hypothetical protein